VGEGFHLFLYLKKMKQTTIRIGQDLNYRLNSLKYKWQFKSLDQVIRRLLEISLKIKRADEVKEK